MKNVEDIYRLSPLQHGLLFHSLQAPGEGLYIEQLSWELRERLEEPRLRSAWQQVLERHPALRTAFFWKGLPEPMQAVRKEVSLRWTALDWQALGAEEQVWRFAGLVEEGRRDFDLTAAPLMRWVVARLGPERYRCLWSYHHLLLDGGAALLCLQEVLRCYEALGRGVPLRLEPVRPFRDYMAWLSQQDGAQAERYWREALKGLERPASLAAPRRQQAQAFHQQSLRLPAEDSQRLHAFLQQHELTLETLVHGAWALLLAEGTGTRDVAFGSFKASPSAPLGEGERMVGLVANTVVARVRLPPEARVLPWLKQLQGEQAEARRYGYAALRDVKRWGGLPRGQSLFHSLVSSEAPLTLEAGGGLLLEEVYRAPSRTGLPLHLQVLPGREVELRLVHEVQWLEDAAARRCMELLPVLLRRLVEGPEQSLAQISQLPEPPPSLLGGEVRALEPASPREYLPPRTPTEQTLARLWREVLGVEQVGLHDDFLDLGGDSLRGIRLLALADKAGLPLSLRQLSESPTLGALAAAIDTAALSSPGRQGGKGARDDDLPMTPAQKWYVETFNVEHDVWAGTLMLDVDPALDLNALRASVAFLYAQHDIFRLRLYRKEGGAWAQRLLPSAGEPIVESVDLSSHSPEAQREAILDKGSHLQARMSIVQGPVLAFTLCRLGDSSPAKLLICLHHCIHDAYSLRLLFEELLGAYLQHAQGMKPTPVPAPTSYVDYLWGVNAYHRSPALERDKAFWLDERRQRSVERLHVDMQGGRHTDRNTQRMTVLFPLALMQSLTNWIKAHQEVSINDVLLFGLGRAYARWSGARTLWVDIEHNGRTGMLQGVDLSRTLGPTSVKYPVMLELDASEEPAAGVASVRQTLRETLTHALGYGFLRYGPDEAVRNTLARISSPQVFFNNRSTLRSSAPTHELLRSQAEFMYFQRLDGGESPVSYDLMLECEGTGNTLAVTWVYSSAIHREATLRALADDMMLQIAALTRGGA